MASTTSDRIGFVVFAFMIWSIAAWMFWMVATFADGQTWWDFSVKLVLYDLVFAIFVFGLALISYACYPNLALQLVKKAATRLNIAIWAILFLVAITLAFVSLVLPVLLHLKMVG